ncbi:hypothetical protein ACWEQC_42845 [Streptomyces shenzhenensis]
MTLGVAGAVLAAAIGVGAWLATSGDDAGTTPQNTHTSTAP